MIFGAILAGGIGSRMHLGDMPKQFLPLGDKPIIIHTVEKFLACPDFDRILIGVHSDWIGYLQDLLNRFVPDSVNSLSIILGGSDRNSTILNLMESIEQQYGESEDHIIVTHDSVRPFVSLQILKENIEAAKLYGAVDTVIPAVDTVVTSQDQQWIFSIPNRVEMYQGQTPQSFRMNLLKRLYLSLSQEEKEILTDACKICVVRNYPVYLVKGSSTNLKITTPGDYQIAQSILESDLYD